MMIDGGLQTPIAALAAGCADLSVTALRGLRPDLAARLGAHARPYVAISLAPLRAAVFVELDEPPDAIPIGVFQGAELPPAFDVAVAPFVEAQLAGLPIEVQRFVAEALKLGARLAIMVAPFPAEIVLTVYAGQEHPIVLSRLTLGTEQFH